MSTLTIVLDSQNHWLADGSQTVWNFEFSDGYINKSHVRAYYESDDVVPVRTDLTINTETDFIGEFQLLISPAVPANYKLVIYRATPRDAPLVNFQDGGGISELNLDTTARQAVMLAQESADFLGVTTTGDLQDLAQSSLANAGAAAASAVAAAGSAASAGGSASAAAISAVNSAASATAASTSAANAAAAAATAVANFAATLLTSAGAAMMGWIHSGTGAVTRLVRDKLRDTINVKDFGAIGDGVADDTAAIQAAINARFVTERMLTRGGVTVVLPEGDFKVTQLRMKRGVSLRGAGIKATRIFTATAGHMIVMDTPTDPDGNQAGFTIEQMMLDCGGADPLAGASRIGLSAINLNGMHQGTLRDCLIQRAATAGVYSDGLVVDFTVERCFIVSNNRGGDHISGLATTIRYNGCQVVFNDFEGIRFDDIPVASLLHTIVEKNYGVGVEFKGATTSATVDHCYFEDNGTSVNLLLTAGISYNVTNTYFTYTPNKGPGLSNVYVGTGVQFATLGNNHFNGAATGNAGSADISGAAGSVETLNTRANVHSGGFARNTTGIAPRLIGDAKGFIRAADATLFPTMTLLNSAGTAVAHMIGHTSRMDFRHASTHRFSDMAGATRAQIDSTGLLLVGGNWNDHHLQLGGTHLWVDGTARLRIKFGAPTSDTDGVVVGTQT